MSLERFLGLVVEVLNAVGVPFMLTGSLAGSYHGAPRATQDIDLIVETDLPSLLRLTEGLRHAGLYVSDEAVREAFEVRGQFNAIDPSSGWKADLILRKARLFSEEEFRRRQPFTFLGLDLSVVSAEDLVIAKLEWARLGDSERQVRDVAEILAVQGDSLDMPRIEKWVREFGLDDLWSRALSFRARPPDPTNSA